MKSFRNLPYVPFPTKGRVTLPTLLSPTISNSLNEFEFTVWVLSLGPEKGDEFLVDGPGLDDPQSRGHVVVYGPKL